jgi:hypothetical protein
MRVLGVPGGSNVGNFDKSTKVWYVHDSKCIGHEIITVLSYLKDLSSSACQRSDVNNQS